MKQDLHLKRLNLVRNVLGGVVVGFLFFWPHHAWEPAWGNAIGAFLVAVGALLQSMHEYKLVEDWAIPRAWAIIVIGAFAVAGASLNMAVFPSS